MEGNFLCFIEINHKKGLKNQNPHDGAALYLSCEYGMINTSVKTLTLGSVSI